MDFDAISWEFMPKGGISTVFSGLIYHLFHACSCRASLWIRLLESRATAGASTSLETGQLGHQEIQPGSPRVLDIDEVAIGYERRRSLANPAACDQALVGDPAGSAAGETGFRQCEAPVTEQARIGEHRRRTEQITQWPLARPVEPRIGEQQHMSAAPHPLVEFDQCFGRLRAGMGHQQ